MNKLSSGTLAALLSFEAGLFLVVGVTMWNGDQSSPADLAIGKLLVTLGAAFGVPAFVMACAWIADRAYAEEAREAAESTDHFA